MTDDHHGGCWATKLLVTWPPTERLTRPVAVPFCFNEGWAAAAGRRAIDRDRRHAACSLVRRKIDFIYDLMRATHAIIPPKRTIELQEDGWTAQIGQAKRAGVQTCCSTLSEGAS